jgi:hypothetical protein
MTEELRKPFFIAAIIVIVVVVLIELGSAALVNNAVDRLTSITEPTPGPPPVGPTATPNDPVAAIRNSLPTDFPAEIRELVSDEGNRDEINDVAEAGENPPGLGIPYMAILDIVIAFTVILMGITLFAPKNVVGRVQGCVTCFLSCSMILAGIVAIIVAFVLLLIMVALLLAVPFGTIVYLAIYGFFAVGAASAATGLVLVLKLIFVVCLILAQQRFLENKSLIILILSSIICTIIVSFLHGFVPGILVSITDAIAAIVVGICGVIWWVLLLIGAIPAIIKALNIKRV